MVLKSTGHTHNWQYDGIQLTEPFETSGFQELERMAFHQSRIPDIRDIEPPDFLIIEDTKQSPPTKSLFAHVGLTSVY